MMGTKMKTAKTAKRAAAGRKIQPPPGGGGGARAPLAVLTERQVRDMLHEHIEQAGGRRALAAEWGVSWSYLAAAARGEKPIGEALLRSMGIAKREVYFDAADDWGIL